VVKVYQGRSTGEGLPGPPVVKVHQWRSTSGEGVVKVHWWSSTTTCLPKSRDRILS